MKKRKRKSNHIGRHIHAMTAAEAFAVAKYSRGKQTIICARCPKWNAGFCTIQAKFMTSRHMACAYGKTLYKAKRQSEKWRVEYEPRGTGKDKGTGQADKKHQ